MTYRDFYNSKGIDLDKVKSIIVEKYNMYPSVVDAGASRLYEKILAGEKVKNISIVSRIIAETKPLFRSRDKIMELSERVSLIERPIRRKLIDYTDSDWRLFKVRFKRFIVYLMDDWKHFKRRYPRLFEKVEI